jgi:hypothetical protein
MRKSSNIAVWRERSLSPSGMFDWHLAQSLVEDELPLFREIFDAAA